MTDERIPNDIMRTAKIIAEAHMTPRTMVCGILQSSIARAILAERNRVHKQLKGED